MQYSDQSPIIQEEDDEYADMPALIENDSEDEYADMPPLDDGEDDMPELMPELVTSPNVSELADTFINNLQIGDTFKTSANYHMIYQGKREGVDLYDFQILDLNNGQTYDTHYSKLGTYVSMGLHEKVSNPSG